jgi:hypothetical protein
LQYSFTDLLLLLLLLCLQAAEYETTLANINELEEALALAQDQVDASHRCGVISLYQLFVTTLGLKGRTTA